MIPKITYCRQHFIDWESVGGQEQFTKLYAEAPNYQQRRFLIDSVLVSTNRKWLDARRYHITASESKKFLTNARNGIDMGETSKDVVRRYLAEKLGFEEQEKTYSEKNTVKRGLLFESRALQLFEQATGIRLETNIGFISTEIDGMRFGCSPDANLRDEKTGKFKALGEVKSYELDRFLQEIEELHSKDTHAQMQMQLMTADCPCCYKILYCAELDKICFLKYTRGLEFKRRIEARIPQAKQYEEKLADNLRYTDLTDKIMAEPVK